MHIELDPALLEEVVFLEIRRREQLGDEAISRDYHKRVDALYDQPDDEESRDIAFRDVHAEFFNRLGFEQQVRDFLDEFPTLRQKLDRITILKAVSRKEEGADLYVRRDEGDGTPHHRVAIVRLQAEVFLDTDRLSILLRHEFYHVSDMLDPTFDYQPDLGDTGESIAYENLVRDRYRVLWDLYIDTRLVRAGHEPAVILEQRRSLLEKAFDSFSVSDTNQVFKTVSNTSPLTHAGLLALAKTCSPNS